MNCTNCGASLPEGVSFCTNCGTPVAAADDGVIGVQDAAASLESAVQANQEAMGVIEARVQADEQRAQQQAEAEAAGNGGAPSYQQPSYDDRPEAPQGYQAAPAAVPFYQQGASPNAHYSSQRTYAENAYGQDSGQPAGYQQPSYGQQASYQQSSYDQQPAAGQAAQQQVWAAQPATSRAYAMLLYLSGLIGVIIGLCVRDKDDAFITHHLNNVLVLFLAGIVGTVLTAVLIGGIVLLFVLVATILGMISAYNGDMKELPLIGKIQIIK